MNLVKTFPRREKTTKHKDKLFIAVENSLSGHGIWWGDWLVIVGQLNITQVLGLL